MMHYTELRKINVNDYIERKNGLAYLSWSWAVDQLLQLDESASWEYAEPRCFGETMNEEIIKKIVSYGYDRYTAERLLYSVNIYTKLKFRNGVLQKTR
jgi:hypothetical protein